MTMLIAARDKSRSRDVTKFNKFKGLHKNAHKFDFVRYILLLITMMIQEKIQIQKLYSSAFFVQNLSIPIGYKRLLEYDIQYHLNFFSTQQKQTTTAKLVK